MSLKRFQFLINGFSIETTGTLVQKYYESHGLVVSFANIKAPTSLQIITERCSYFDFMGYGECPLMKTLDNECLSCFVELLFLEETTVEQACSIVQKLSEQYNQPLHITPLFEKEDDICLRDVIHSVNFCWEKDSFFSNNILAYFSSPPKLRFSDKDNSYNFWFHFGFLVTFDSILDSFYFVKLAVSLHGCLLENATSWTKNRSVVYEAVKSDGSALRYVSSQLLYDRDIIWTALKSDRSAIKYIPKEFFSDKSFALFAVNYDYQMFDFVITLQNDIDVEITALKNALRSYQDTILFIYLFYPCLFKDAVCRLSSHNFHLFETDEPIPTCQNMHCKEIAAMIVAKYPILFKHLHISFQQDVNIIAGAKLGTFKYIMSTLFNADIICNTSFKYLQSLLIVIHFADFSTLWQIFLNLYTCADIVREFAKIITLTNLLLLNELFKNILHAPNYIRNIVWPNSSVMNIQHHCRYDQKQKRNILKKQRKLKMFY